MVFQLWCHYLNKLTSPHNQKRHSELGKRLKKGNDDINVSGNLEEPQGPIRRALSMLSFLNTVNTKANRRCDINLYQLFFEADIVKYMLNILEEEIWSPIKVASL